MQFDPLQCAQSYEHVCCAPHDGPQAVPCAGASIGHASKTGGPPVCSIVHIAFWQMAIVPPPQALKP
jgi:hypothetical protein